MFYQLFFLPQVKRCAIITYKHDIYELPHEFAAGGAYVTTQEKKRDLGSQKIRKYQESLKLSWNDSLVPSVPAKMKILLIVAKNS